VLEYKNSYFPTSSRGSQPWLNENFINLESE